MICGLLSVLRFATFLKHSNLQTDICSKVVELLDQRNILLSSIDLVCFSWVEENEDDEESEDNKDIKDVDIEVAPYGTVVTTPVMI